MSTIHSIGPTPVAPSMTLAFLIVVHISLKIDISIYRPLYLLYRKSNNHWTENNIRNVRIGWLLALPGTNSPSV